MQRVSVKSRAYSDQLQRKQKWLRALTSFDHQPVVGNHHPVSSSQWPIFMSPLPIITCILHITRCKTCSLSYIHIMCASHPALKFSQRLRWRIGRTHETSTTRLFEIDLGFLHCTIYILANLRWDCPCFAHNGTTSIAERCLFLTSWNVGASTGHIRFGQGWVHDGDDRVCSCGRSAVGAVSCWKMSIYSAAILLLIMSPVKHIVDNTI